MSRAKRNGFANGAAAYRGTPSSFSATALFVGCVFFALCLPSPASAQTAKTHAAFTLSGDLDGAGAELGRITVDLAKEACDAGYCLTPEAIARLARKYFGTENPSLQVELVPQEGGKATPDGRFFDKPPVAKIRVTFA